MLIYGTHLMVMLLPTTVNIANQKVKLRENKFPYILVY